MNPELQKAVKAGFCDAFGTSPQVVTRAPGRLEILGNHTDYNEGLVFSTAVDCSMYVAASAKHGDTLCRMIDSGDGSERSFQINDIGSAIKGDWCNYIKGVVVAMQERGIVVPAFDLCLQSDIPPSAGMSSSAAFEMSVAYALGILAGVELPLVEWAKIGQHSENNYVGARTGLLDQLSSVCGAENALVLSDFRSLEVVNVAMPKGLALVVVNSMVKHDLTAEYNERRESCESAAAFFAERVDGVSSLRDVTGEMLEQYKSEMNPIHYKRAKHIVGENERVLAGKAALNKGDLEGFGKLLFESHESSREYFENSCDELDILIELGKSIPGVYGARLSGGGFGGITVHLVKEDIAATYRDRLATAFETRTGIKPQAMICVSGDGAEILEESN